MQVYWFYLIMKVVQKIVLGKGLKDSRETDEEEEAWEKAMKKEKEMLVKKKKS